jgi:glycerate kinase
MTGLTDVRNPLLGPQGASRVYGPQKGAAPDDVDQLEAALAHLVDIAARDLGASDPAFSGAGAAGGLGYGVMTFFNGQLRSGFDTIAEMTGLPAALAAADLVVTGEGRLDTQTGAGKAPAGVARLARAAGKPVIALAGSVPLTKEDGPGFDATLSITRQPMSLEDAMQNAGSLLEEAADRAARLIRLGTLL